MNLTAILLLACCLQLSARGFSQNLSLSVKNEKIEDVFKTIKKQTGYSFIYGEEQVKGARRVSLSVTNASLSEVLENCFRGQLLTYVILDRIVVVKTISNRQSELVHLEPQVSAGIITGTVKDEKDKPMEKVSVKNIRTGKAVATDSRGVFVINANVGETLEFSFIGYGLQSYVINGNNTTDNPGSTYIPIAIKMKVEEKDMGDMVVVGYGSVRRKDLTGSVSSVDVNEVKNVPFVSIDQALSGKAAGVQVIQADGSPGGVAKIRIRGGTSLLGGNDPLYIIDGVQVTIQNRYIQSAAEIVNPVERFGQDDPNSSVSGAFARGLNSLAGLNINDIESIDILKDASATAIYGSKAANGVVIINTKKGKLNQKPVLEGNYYAGFSKPIKEKLLDADQYKMIMKEGSKNLNDARALQSLAPNPVASSILNNPDFLGTANTDWLGMILRTGITHNADISVRGGGQGSRYYTSLAYSKQDGVLKGTDFNRIAGKISLDNEITDRLRVITNLDYGFTKNNITNGVYSNALYAPPTFDPYNADGSPKSFNGTSFGGYAYEGYQNPLLLLQGTNESKTSSLLGSLSGEYNILSNLKFRSTLSVNYNNYHQLNYIPSTVQIASESGTSASNGGMGTQAQTEQTDVFYENTLTWEKQFNSNNRINVLGGTSWQKSRFNSFSASGQGFPDDKFLNGLSSAAIPLMPSGTSGQNSLLSFYLRANYAFKERYLLTFTGRSDASSKFPESNRVGYFPSGGFAWRVTEEEFMKKATWINELKLRVSAGYTGTQNIGDNLFYTLYTPGSYGGTNALVPTQLGNNKIKWESTLQKDLGIDFALFKSRLRGSIGYYQKYTTGLLLNSPVASSSGFNTVIGNIADIRNKGLEIDIRGDIIKHKNFQWSGALNISGNRSKVEKVTIDFTNPGEYTDYGNAYYNSVFLGNNIVREGEPLGLIYGYQFDGIIKTQKQLDDYKAKALYAQYGIIPYLGIGDAMYKTVDTGDFKGLFAPNIIGNAQPKFYGGFTNTFTYKNFSLIGLLTYSYGGDILYLADVQNTGLGNRANRGVRILDRWTPENTGSDRPRLILTETGNSGTSPASNNVYDASFIKLKSITVNYQFPKQIIDKLKVREASFYASATNLFTITNYPGADPEVSNNPYSLIGGYSDSGGYPTTKQFSIGLRLGL